MGFIIDANILFYLLVANISFKESQYLMLWISISYLMDSNIFHPGYLQFHILYIEIFYLVNSDLVSCVSHVLPSYRVDFHFIHPNDHVFK